MDKLVFMPRGVTADKTALHWAHMRQLALTHKDRTLKHSIITLPVSLECHSSRKVHEVALPAPASSPWGHSTLLKTWGQTCLLLLLTFFQPKNLYDHPQYKSSRALDFINSRIRTQRNPGLTCPFPPLSPILAVARLAGPRGCHKCLY